MKNLIKSVMYTGSSELLAKVSGIILFIYYYSILPRDVMGALLTLYSLMLTSWVAIDLGSSLYGTRLVASKNEEYWDSIQLDITKIRLFMAVIAALALICYSFIYFKDYIIIALLLSINLLVKSIAADWRLKGEMRFKELSRILTYASMILLISGLAVGLMEDTRLVSLPWLFYTLVITILTIKKTKMKATFRDIFKWKFYEIYNGIRESKHYALSNGLSAIVQQTPIIIIAHHYPAAEIATYALAHRLVISSTFLVQVVGNVIYPWISKNHRTKPIATLEATLKAIKLTAAIASILSLIIICIIIYYDLLNKFHLDLSHFVVVYFLIYFTLRATRVIHARYMLATHLVAFYSRIVIYQAGLMVLSYLYLLKINMLDHESITFIFMMSEAILLFILNFKITWDKNGL